MKSRRIETPFVSSLKLGLLCIVFACFGCMSGQITPLPLAPSAIQRLTDCVKQRGACTVIHVRNHNTQGATVSVNGFRLDYIEGNSSAAWPIPDSRLDGGRCAAVVVVLRVSNDYASSKECVREGQAFTLDIEAAPSGTPFQVWLNPYGRVEP